MCAIGVMTSSILVDWKGSGPPGFFTLLLWTTFIQLSSQAECFTWELPLKVDRKGRGGDGHHDSLGGYTFFPIISICFPCPFLFPSARLTVLVGAATSHLDESSHLSSMSSSPCSISTSKLFLSSPTSSSAIQYLSHYSHCTVIS